MKSRKARKSHARRTRRDFLTWLSNVEAPQSAGSAPKRRPRNRFERMHRDLASRAKMAYFYSPPKGKKFATKAKPYNKMICDPVTGQWWNRGTYNLTQALQQERRKLRRRDEPTKKHPKGRAYMVSPSIHDLPEKEMV